MQKRLEFILFSLLIVLLPSQLALHYWSPWSLIETIRIDYLAPTLYFTDLLLFLLLVLTRSKLHFPWWLLAFAVLNTIFSISPPVTVFKWLQVAKYLWFFSYLRLRLPHLIHRLKTPLAISLIWSSALALLQFITQHSQGGIWYWLGERSLHPTFPGLAKIVLNPFGLLLRPYSTFPHPNALAGFLCVGIFILFYLQSPKLRPSPHLILASIVSTLALLLSFSRSSTIFFTLSLFLLFITKARKYLLAVLLPILVVIIAISISIGNPSSLSERLLLITKALPIISHNPLLGIGLGSFPAFPGPYFSNTPFSLNFQPVHNIPLLVLSELGVLIPVILTLYWHSILSSIPPLSKSFGAGIFFILSSSLFDHYWLTSHQNLMLLTIFFALLAIESQHARPT